MSNTCTHGGWSATCNISTRHNRAERSDHETEHGAPLLVILEASGTLCALSQARETSVCACLVLVAGIRLVGTRAWAMARVGQKKKKQA